MNPVLLALCQENWVFVCVGVCQWHQQRIKPHHCFAYPYDSFYAVLCSRFDWFSRVALVSASNFRHRYFLTIVLVIHSAVTNLWSDDQRRVSSSPGSGLLGFRRDSPSSRPASTYFLLTRVPLWMCIFHVLYHTPALHPLILGPDSPRR